MSQSDEATLPPSDLEVLDNTSQKSYALSEGIKDGHKRACIRCDWRRPKPRLGHTLCSHHRVCSLKEFWTPMQCDPCNEQLDRMKEMDPQELILTKKHFDKMLSETYNEFKTRGRTWEYKLPAQVFFGEVGGFNQRPENTNYNLEPPSAMESDDGQGDSTHAFPDTD